MRKRISYPFSILLLTLIILLNACGIDKPSTGSSSLEIIQSSQFVEPIPFDESVNDEEVSNLTTYSSVPDAEQRTSQALKPNVTFSGDSQSLPLVSEQETPPIIPSKQETPIISNVINIEFGNNKFTATLADNPSTEAFKAMLPLTIEMSDMNNNEKYYYMSDNLPINSRNVGTVNNGDIMLYGSDCLVLFYETFSTSYTYTLLGTVDNPSGLEDALGSGSVQVTWSLSV